MSRQPRKQTAPTTGLLSSLKVLSEITTNVGEPYETHVLLKDNWATAFNGIIAAGARIEESFHACPHNDLLISALSKCGQSIAFTQLDSGRLSIKSDKFRALVPCLNPDDMPRAVPDSPVAQLDDRLKASFQAVLPLADEGENDLLTASVLIHGGSIFATDRRVIIEHWHGIDLPPMLAIPKSAIHPIIKNARKLTQFGFSQSSATFYYEDDSWLRTQYFAKPWPDVRKALDVKCNAWPLPEDFYKAVRALEPFSENGLVFFDAGVMRSHADETKGASYELYGLPKGNIMSIKQLKMIEPFVQTVDFSAVNNHGQPITLWFGQNCRGAIAGREK